ncbi:hypothetical protein SLE2022_117420 [Rubroshorea leprosula]
MSRDTDRYRGLINWRQPGYNYGANYANDSSYSQPVLSRPLSFHAPALLQNGGSSWVATDPRQTHGEWGVTRPFNFPGFFEQQRSPIRVVVHENGLVREVNPSRRLEPRYRAQQEDYSSSRLTKDEQKEALSKLRKEVYNPTPEKMTRRLNLYYRGSYNGEEEKAKEKDDEEGKRCAVCLEDFVAKEVVTVTPCNHMFHEECIVPWVKSHGLCPVCRSVISDRARESRVGAPREVVNLAASDMFASELISIIRTMEEAFLWTNNR